MNYVEKLYDGIHTVFNLNAATLSGSIDIIAVEQEDGTLKSTPFHVRFGKLHMLKNTSNTLSLFVNGEDSGITMKLGHAGEAFFEVEDFATRHRRTLSEGQSKTKAQRILPKRSYSQSKSSSASSLPPFLKERDPQSPTTPVSFAPKASKSVPSSSAQLLLRRSSPDNGTADDEAVGSPDVTWSWGAMPQSKSPLRQREIPPGEDDQDEEVAEDLTHPQFGDPTGKDADRERLSKSWKFGVDSFFRMFKSPKKKSTPTRRPVLVREESSSEQASVSEHIEGEGTHDDFTNSEYFSGDEVSEDFHDDIFEFDDPRTNIRASSPRTTWIDPRKHQNVETDADSVNKALENLTKMDSQFTSVNSVRRRSLKLPGTPEESVPSPEQQKKEAPTESPLNDSEPHTAADTASESSPPTSTSSPQLPTAPPTQPPPPAAAVSPLPRTMNPRLGRSVSDDGSDGVTKDVQGLKKHRKEASAPVPRHKSVDETASITSTTSERTKSSALSPRGHKSKRAHSPRSSSKARAVGGGNTAERKLVGSKSDGHVSADSASSPPAASESLPREANTNTNGVSPAFPSPSEKGRESDAEKDLRSSKHTRKKTKARKKKKASTRFAISRCGDSLFSGGQKTRSEKAAIFEKHRIDYQEYMALLRVDTTALFDPDIIFCINSNYYPWPVAGPMMVSLLAFDTQIQPDVMDLLIDENNLEDAMYDLDTPRPSPTPTRPSEGPIGDDRKKGATPSKHDRSRTKKSRPWYDLFSFTPSKGAPDLEVEVAPVTDEDTEGTENSVKFSLEDGPTDLDYELALLQEQLDEDRTLTTESEGNSKDSSQGNLSSNGEHHNPNSPPTRSTLTPPHTVLSRLNLKKGPNVLSFRLHSKDSDEYRQISSTLYLWDRHDKIVISDIDGTITKSDVFGQILPVVFGQDWSHDGVANLYSDIHKNGYRVMYLTARAIGQSSLTKDYISSLTQSLPGSGLPEEAVKQTRLPDGPVFMSPDRLLRSFSREVIQRTPHEFKMACLNAVSGLFPSNPFYAGFGNRISDTISYRGVGVPESRIFEINHFGEITTATHSFENKKYSELNELVNEIFPVHDSQSGVTEVEPEYTEHEYWKSSIGPSLDDIEKELFKK